MTTSLPPVDRLLDLLPDAVCVVDADGVFLYVSAGFEQILGYPRDEVLGRRTFDFVHRDDHAATVEQAARVMDGAVQRHFRNRYVHKSGHLVDIQWSARWDSKHGVRIAVAREVTELRRVERELEHRATHDPLTALPNRHCLQIELDTALDAALATGVPLALLYLDLDGFKSINDQAGHHVGDRVLRDVATCLLQASRKSDLVARIGGDEFVVLLRGCDDAATAQRIAEGLRARISVIETGCEPALTLDASFGVARFPDHGTTADELLAHADRAMYAVKRERASAVDVGTKAVGSPTG